VPINILMPALSPTMTEGNLAKWHKKPGDAVKSGEVIAEIETDKATMEVEAVDEGVIGKILVEEGAQAVKVNDIIAILLEDGESAADLKTANDKGSAGAGAQAPVAAPAAQTPLAPTPHTPPPTPAQLTPGSGSGGRIIASPLAKRIAGQQGLDLAGIKGSGPQGRIVRADVEAAVKAGGGGQASGISKAPASLMPHPSPLMPQTARFEKHTTMRQVIARRLTESKQTVPHFYLTVDVELDRLLALRKQINDRPNATAKLSVNDFIIKACGVALREVPAANASWTPEGVYYYDQADISVAVAIDGGLITPIVRAAEGKGLVAISTEMKDLAARAKANKLKPEEFQGGTFSLSNLGMFGVKHFQAIINPPQGCILAVGAGEERPVVRAGKIEVATVMSCTLSVDHRVVDGAVGAAWLAAFKRLVESPLDLVLN
jgi:pyruvate dehydrogenase E2 component (dihydrolipoamide acetyltransferase)